MHSEQGSSHRQILKATSIVGGAQVITIVFRILRSKVIAVLLGPMGVGIIGLFQSTLELLYNATGFGLHFSAVRDIAEATGTNDEHRISKTILIMRRWIWFTGLLGMVIMAIFSKPLSRYAFGDEKYARGIIVLSLALLMMAISEGQLAVLRGLRRIGRMAKANVLGVVAGFLFSVPLYWFFGLRGIVPALLLSYAVVLLITWCYSRQIRLLPISMNLKETFTGGMGMVKLGFFMVITGLVTTGTMYLVRIFVSKKAGIGDVGQFQAAWNLSALYVGIVLQSMGADYFPRLSTINQDNQKVVKLVNEQTEVALLIAGPMVVGMLCFMNLVVYLLYSSEFGAAIPILHWQLAGTLLKVICWPMAFVLLAKGKGALYITTELTWNLFYLLMLYFGWNYAGLEMTGISFLASFVFYVILLLLINRKLCNFRWSPTSIKYIIIFFLLTFLAFLSARYLPSPYLYLTGVILSCFAVIYSYLELRKIVDLKTIVNKILKR